MEIGAQAQTQAQAAGQSPDPKNGGRSGKGQIPVAKRACDCCRKRKVRCDGREPCSPCQKAAIRCAYIEPPKKKGPKGLRSARVLHALRRIDDTPVSNPPTPTSSDVAFGNWGWSAAAQHHGQGQNDRPETIYVSPDQRPYYQQQPPTSYQHSNNQRDPSQNQQQWAPSQAESISTASNGPHHGHSPTSTETYNHRLLSEKAFLPFIKLFFNHMFAIMPVIGRGIYLDPAFYSQGTLSAEVYCFLSALCAATIVQLDESIAQPPLLHPSKHSDDLFAEECLRERKTFDPVEHVTPLSVMTSFFLFCYYGNHEKHLQAWHYLQESITFSEILDMDDEASYAQLDPVEMQWRRRLYWLLFITERAYAVQRRKRTRLQASVALPAVFESEDPQLLSGFVNLANLFSAVDDSFVSAWRGTRRASLCDEAWLAQTHKQLDATAHTTGMGELTEIQTLDIGVTREWLHVLAWQMGVSTGLIWGQGEGGMRLDYPVELARKVVEMTSNASPLSLDSHGIGMEQKLSDIAGCLADVLKCTAGDCSATFLEGKQHLNTLLHRLSSMRGKESRYLKPLMAKMEGLMGYEINNVTLPLPEIRLEGVQGDGHLPATWSASESMTMLRHLSMAGSLGMPGIALAQDSYYQRRPSGWIVEENDMEHIQPWLADEKGFRRSPV
ncbi:uncharacterized protein RCC_04697 [Ramularia collo-cygni]|uniref:Zn(2)-C6 fungal-type domain-containing protein n=1 Tax=Ramularia collo-cygni TaxID=112498 RepID=A0A2D3UQ38_9PEZI|nr:uncharacterized protein RCC_04697 [Ramularia collo-cygni]CZT18852.1 uncharacterized protein RCC_04697 [Ramularia collo-cygni]